MEELSRLSSKVDEIAGSVARLEERLAKLERTVLASGSRPRAESAPAASEPPLLPPRQREFQTDLALIGRSIIVIGGGYALRAVTELRVVPDALGIAAGLVFTLVLIALADRAAARGATASSGYHGATAVLVGYALIAELVMRFELVSPAAGALLILIYGGALLAVVYRRRGVALAWIVTIATVAVTAVLGVKTRDLVPYAWVLTALAAATGWLGPRLGQRFLVWPVAIVGDLLVLGAALVILHGFDAEASWSAPVLSLAFFLVFAVGAMRRAIVDGRRTTVAEMAQCSVAFLVGVVEGAPVAVALDGGVAFGAAALALALAGTVAAMRWLEQRPERVTVAFWTSLWFAVAQAALCVLARGAALVAGEIAIAAALMVADRRRTHPVAELHAVIALAVAAAAAGLLAFAARALVGPPVALAPDPLAIATLAALIAATGTGFREPAPGSSPLMLAAKITSLALTVFCVAGVLAGVGISIAGPSPAVAAAIRTGLLSLGAIALAAASRARLARSASHLVYPLLALTGVKLIAEDFVIGVAAAQFVGLAMFGVALIVGPRLRYRPPAASRPAAR